jgi:hypothetical protein
VRGPVCIVYDDESKARPVARALMAHEVELELLDVDALRYGWMIYNTAQIRRGFDQAKIPQMEPWVLWTTQRWALEIIGKLAS